MCNLLWKQVFSINGVSCILARGTEIFNRCWMDSDQFQATIRPEDLTHHSFTGNEELDVFSVIFGLERSIWLTVRWDKHKLFFQVRFLPKNHVKHYICYECEGQNVCSLIPSTDNGCLKSFFLSRRSPCGVTSCGHYSICSCTAVSGLVFIHDGTNEC